MNRETHILRHLETALAATPDGLAAQLDLGTRSIVNAVARLDAMLGTAASVRLVDGRYRLYILDARRYGEIRQALLDADESLNDPAHRRALIYRALLRAAGPVRIGDLASRLSVSRTTATTDLAALRETLAGHDVTITGRTNSGVRLEGSELDLRMAGLTHFAEVLCDHYPLGDEIAETVASICTSRHLNRSSRHTVLRWLTMLLDRYLSGHPLTELPPEFSELEGTPAHDFAAELLAGISPLVRIDPPPTEQLFMAMAVAGMRTPDDQEGRQLFPADEDVPALVDAIFDRITEVMGLQVEAAELADEFAHHLTFMLSRMRFRIHLDDDAVADIRDQYPVAHQMAEISRQVLEERTGLRITDSEVGLLAGYHQVFLDHHERSRRTHLRVAVVTSAGRVSGHLLRIQLARILPESARFIMMSADQLDDDALTVADLVVATPGALAGTGGALSSPVVELGAVFDRKELVNQLSRIRLHRYADLQLAGAGSSLLVSMLDPDRFMALPPGTDYHRATAALIDRLEELGLVEESFREALGRRERDSSMLLDELVGFPHATVPGAERVVLAMGVIPRSLEEPGVRAVFVMGVPDKQDYDDTILIDIYDEIIRLASDRSLITSLSRVTSHEQLFWFMADHPTRTNR